LSATVNADHLFVGVKGSVAAFERTTGQEVWRTRLKGGDFVTLLIDTDAIFAHTKGWLYCLDPATGRIEWSNGLPGLGYGFATLGTITAHADQVAAMKLMTQRRQAAAAASAGGAAGAGA
jgi:outer membrane protein assembly factor BamB